MIRISLRAARVNAELEQGDVASKIGVTAKTLSKYERGITAIPGFLLEKVADIYNVPVDSIRLPIVNDGKYDDFFYEEVPFKGIFISHFNQ
ncbi:helix-turn-helix domain-containing protein [Lysinibacillus sp. NPDC096418]|uniref:helix-turn-helix domain-containing protein n=1 Tax=Lysinibacillus sp. NPDC096418 TaxID=3364138 RepID=UPI0038233B82